MRIEYKDLRVTKASHGSDAYHDVSHTAWHVTAPPALDVHYIQWGTSNMSGADWCHDLHGSTYDSLARLLGHEVLVSGAPEGTDAGTYDDGSVDLDELIHEVIEDLADRGDVTVTSPDTEAPYRLVGDENEPLTIDAVAGVTEPPAPHIEGDPLSENYESAKRVATTLVREERGWRDDEEVMKDLLSDMFHLADLLGLDMDDLVNSAQRHYEAEIRGVL